MTKALFAAILTVCGSLAAATTPVVTVTSPKSGAQDSSPVNFTASATSPDCSAGISAMRIYPSPGDAAYTTSANQLDFNVNLTPGSYAAVVQAWDKCGGVGKTTVNITVTTTATLPPPRFLYATEYSAGKVGGYVVNPQSGALTSTGQPPVWAHWGPTRLASDSGGYRLYAANQGSMDVSAFFINRTNGYLTAVPGANFPAGGWSTDIAVHPSNKFVYVTTRNVPQGGQNSVSAFSVASNGSLTTVPGSPFLTSLQYQALAIDPTGKYLYASGFGQNPGGLIGAYSIDQKTGAIAELPGSPYTIVPYNCTYCSPSEYFPDLAIDHTGQYLIGPGSVNGVIYVYRIDSGTGALTSVPGSPFIDDLKCGSQCPGAGPDSVTVSGNNKFVFVQNTFDENIVTYQLNSSTGALTLVSKTYDLGEDCVRADPSGSFVYSFENQLTQSKGLIFGFATDQSNGSLAATPGSPYPDNGVDSNAPVDCIAVTQ